MAAVKQQAPLPLPDYTTGMDAVPLADATLVALSDEIRRTRRPKVITRDGAPDLVVLSVDAYEELREALEIAAGITRGLSDLASGRVHSDEEVQAMLRERIDAAASVRTEDP
jgi:prevent-host-death family protein